MISVDMKSFFPVPGFEKKYALHTSGNIYNIETGRAVRREKGSRCNFLSKNGKNVRFNVNGIIKRYILDKENFPGKVYPIDGDFSNLSADNTFISQKKLYRLDDIVEREDFEVVKEFRNFIISKSGSVYRQVNGNWFSKCSKINQGGYLSICMNDTVRDLHRLLGLTFLCNKLPENLFDLIFVRHIDKDKKNNSISNLEILFVKSKKILSKALVSKVSEKIVSVSFPYNNEIIRIGYYENLNDAEEDLRLKVFKRALKDVPTLKMCGYNNVEVFNEKV